MKSVEESDINIVSTHTKIEGKIAFDRVTRVYGSLTGEITSTPGSLLILMDTSVVEGDIDADTLVIAGYVRGNIRARTQVTLSPGGRVIGNIRAPSVKIDFGACLEGQCMMEQERKPNMQTQPSPT